MQFSASSPQYAFGPGLAPASTPMYKGGGDVQQTYGLRNAAEQLRERGRGDDTILAHINPQEAGILKLLGGSGTINPHTGLPEYGWVSKTWKQITKPIKQAPILGDIYKVGSSIGKEIERGVESIAQNKYLGPIAQMASYLHPVSAALYAGLSPEGSSFDVKGAAKAAAMQQIMSGVKEYAMGTPAGGGIGSEGASMSDLPYSGYGGPGGYGPGAFDADIGIDAMSGGPGTVEAAVSSAGAVPQAIPYPPDPNSYLGGAPSMGEFASAPINAPVVDGYPSAPSAPTTPTIDPYEIDNIGNVSDSRVMGDYGYGSAPVETYDLPRAEDATGIRGLDAAGENYLGAAGSLAEGAYDLAASNPMTTAAIAYGGYTAYQTKKELDAAKEEADRILADIENRKQEEIEWARGVMRDYAPNYERLTAEEVARERGMAMGGIASFDDERGSDDELMQGGIASLAKGGLPPRYLQGAGDGMSDSIHARIGGKQEARLADGEFVIPADVVSHLGNGSSNAGAKKLYTMMDRVRNARTGKKRQAPQVKTDRYMPA